MRCAGWLRLVILGSGLAAACSKTGPDDGAGGQPGQAGRGGSIGSSHPAGAGGAAPAVTELSCLQTLTADCPTEPGTCHARTIGGGGATGASMLDTCYASGTKTKTTLIDCDAQTGQMHYRGDVYKPDGTLCYSFSRVCACRSSCDTASIEFRGPDGALVATGQTGPAAAFGCVNGAEVCTSDRALVGLCIPYLPGFQCVVDENCPSAL